MLLVMVLNNQFHLLFCSMFSLLFLHLFMYGCNIFMWRKARINYSFIFEFAPTEELKYRDVFLICTTSMTMVVGVMFVHLSLVAKGHSSTEVHAIPGLLLLVIFSPALVFLLWNMHNEIVVYIGLNRIVFYNISSTILLILNYIFPLLARCVIEVLLLFFSMQFFLLLLLCPLNILYRSSRYHFLQVIRNIILSPLYKVWHCLKLEMIWLIVFIPENRFLSFCHDFIPDRTMNNHCL